MCLVMIKVGTSIPKVNVFRFESFWADKPGFLDTVQSAWQTKVLASNTTTNIVAKFKLLRRVLKRWALGLSKLKMQISQCNDVLLILDKLEENRTLFPQKNNLKETLKDHVLKLLHFQKQYWR
jgi:hypothetical protein